MNVTENIMNLNIMELKKSPHLSASSISDFMSCGYLYELSRVKKITPSFISDSLVFGSTIHKTLQEFYMEKMIGYKLSVQELQQIFETIWNEATEGKNIRYSKNNSHESLLAEGKKLLEIYCENIPENNNRIVSIEEPLSFTIDGLPVPIIGVTDLIEENKKGDLIITDWKTANKAYSKSKVDNDLQLTIYNLGIKNIYGKNRKILLKFDCLIKSSKNPRLEQYITTRSNLDEKRAINQIKHIWKAVMGEIYVPNYGHWKCTNCAYKKHCDNSVNNPSL